MFLDPGKDSDFKQSYIFLVRSTWCELVMENFVLDALLEFKCVTFVILYSETAVHLK